MKQALILVDIQNDFLPGGALAVPHGDEVIKIANERMPQYELVVATQDWHPTNHLSFASQHLNAQPGDVIDLDGDGSHPASLRQTLWPDHCIEGSTGAEFASDLNLDGIHKVFQKGTDRNLDSYSGFFDNTRLKATGLESFLRDHNVTCVDVMGLATDYCVKFTTLDALDLGFQTTLLLDGVRGVELSPGDCDAAIREMQAAGAVLQPKAESK